jgi:hypothetical protein
MKLPDTSYQYKYITEEQMESQATYVEFVNGVEVPFPKKKFSELQDPSYTLPPKDYSKRKADGDPDGQPSPKIAARSKDDDVPEMPRHAGGLLSAVEDVETQADAGENAQASAAAAEAVEIDDVEEINGLPIPRFTGQADEYGFRVTNKRPTKEDIPNNRILAPPSIVWDDDEIGFRDSTNNPQKGATKARRRMYLSQPNSNVMHYDRRVWGWDSSKVDEDDMDQDLVRKHNVHPRLGFFLPNSVNDSEPLKPLTSGNRPIVFVGPSGQVLHSSRSIWGARLDDGTDELERKAAIGLAVQTFRSDEDIAEEDIEPSPELRDEHRRAVLLERDIDPDAVFIVQESEDEDLGPTQEEITTFTQDMVQILEAASVLEYEQDAMPPPRAPKSQTQSRPYDAIRDVFTGSSPPRPSPSPPMQEPPVDSYPLLYLAEVAEGQPRGLEPLYNPSAPPQAEFSMLDPQLFSHASNNSDAGMSRDFGPPPDEYARSNEYQPPPEYGHQPPWSQPPPPPPPDHMQLEHIPRDHVQSSDSMRSNDFLRTALNPPPTNFPPMVTAPSPPPRVPFTNTGASRGSLPALRPVRTLLEDPQAPLPPDSQDPNLQRPGMVVSNSGAYYPPAPNRPFHNGYSHPEQQPLPGIQAPPPGPPSMQAQPPMQSAQLPPPYPTLSPPPYHPSLPPIPPPIGQGQPPPLMPQSMSPSTPPRGRPGSSSAASSKYRKLEPAPTPPHRTGYPGNGQELRTVQFDYREAIKDYTPVEAPPRHGPTHIRGWTHNNLKKARGSSRGGESGGPEDQA